MRVALPAQPVAARLRHPNRAKRPESVTRSTLIGRAERRRRFGKALDLR